MDYYYQLEKLPTKSNFKKDDLFILFGELFSRGYANGIVDEAKKAGMEILGITVGRRDKGLLRPLTAEELLESEKNISGKIINIPLEAGFDMEKTDNGQSLVEILNDTKFDDWQSLKISQSQIDSAFNAGKARFNKALLEVVKELKSHYKKGKNIYFAHIMAGGVPRSKIMLVVANRVFKGRGDRYIPSGDFWQSSLGRIADKSFNEVTANTFNYLIEATKEWRTEAKENGDIVCYSAYGYHGCEILIKDNYLWQTYTPYQQGHAKKLLESYAIEAHKNGIQACVFNCPEIRTNSSDVFAGVELSLYPFLLALKKEIKSEVAVSIWQQCQVLLNDDIDLESEIKKLNEYFFSTELKSFQNINNWPQENNPAIAEIMVGTSERITNLHKDRKLLITDLLSALIIKLTGRLIFNHVANANRPVIWVGHKIIAQELSHM